MGDWSPLEKQEMRTVITVRGAIEAVNLVRVRVIAVRGWCYVDPLLLPLPHRPIEHRGWSVPGRGSTRSGPNSLHGSPIPLRWRFAGRPIRGKIKKKNFALIFGSLASFSLSLSRKDGCVYGLRVLEGLDAFTQVILNQGRPRVLDLDLSVIVGFGRFLFCWKQILLKAINSSGECTEVH